MSIFPKFSIQIVVFATLCILPLCALPFVELLADNAKPEKLKVLSIGLYTLAGIFFLLTVFSKYYDNIIETITEYLENNTSMKLNITEDMRKLEAYSCAFFLMVVAATTIIIIIFGKEARFLYREDGIAESLTSIFYLLSTVICLTIFWKARGYKYLRINLLILALLFFFVGMEEISWGQRVFNLMTPEVMKGINIQNEITLHNIWSISLTTYPALTVVSCLLFIFPLMNRYGPQYQRLFSALQFPLTPFPIAMCYLAVVLAYVIIGLRLGTPTPLPISFYGVMPSADDEILEFFISMQFFITAIGGWRLKF